MMTNPDAQRAYQDLSTRIDTLRHRSHHEDSDPTIATAIVPFENRAELAACLTARAHVRESFGQHEDALADYDDALHRFCQMGSSAEVVTCLMDRATCLVALNRPQGALIDIDSAVSLCRESGTAAALAIGLQFRAQCLLLLKQEEHAQEAIAEVQQLLTPPTMVIPFGAAATPARKRA